MIALSLTFLRNGGGPRAALVAGCTAVVSGLLLVMLTLVLFTASTAARSEQLSNLVLEGELRAGLTVSLALICLAPLTLLQQVLRLGTASREQRFAALRLAGATPSDVRRLGAWEVGIPALVGGLLGYLVFSGLRLLFGGAVGARTGSYLGVEGVAAQLRLVPTTVHPAWWQVLLVAAAVGLLGALAGYLTSRPVEVSPLGVSRRSARPAPRPWLGLVLVVVVPVVMVGLTILGLPSTLTMVICLFSLVLGLLTLTPWIAHRVGRLVAARAASVPLLVAARRLAADARATGRAAATIGAISMVAAGGGVALSTLPGSYQGGGFDDVEAFYLVPMALGAIVLVVALALAVFSMAVHGAESLVDRRRSIASLAALGVEMDDLTRIQRWEVSLVAVPVAVLGVVVGSVPFLVLAGERVLAYAWIPLTVDVVTVALVWAAALLSTRLTRPWLARAASPANLRTA